MIAFAFALAAASLMTNANARAATSPADLRIAYIPIDDRPATELFPSRVAAICGAHLELPPQSELGHFQRPGDGAAIGRWLLASGGQRFTAIVVSTDMLAYGGLVASRTPATTLGAALYNLRALPEFHKLRPDVPIYAFGTVMRLAPTATTATEPYLEALTHYAQLAGAQSPSAAQRAALAISRGNIPDRVFWDYIGSRARDLDVDEALITMASAGDFTALALTQDDAGSPDGVQAPEEARLRALVDRLGLRSRVLLNPGTDEMGMVMVVRAIEDAAGWAPAVKLTYPSATAAQTSDRLEYLPIGETVANLASFLKMPVRDDADFELATIAPDADPAVSAFDATIEARLRAGAPTAIADLSFLNDDDLTQRRMAESLGEAGLGAKPLAFSSWNTTANTVGTALAEAAATLVGRRFATLDEGAAATFLYERYVDDYGYRLLVRPQLQAQLRGGGFDTYVLGDAAATGESRARSMLWPVAISIFDEYFKPEGWRDRGTSIYLPWQRTFEVRVDAQLDR